MFLSHNPVLFPLKRDRSANSDIRCNIFPRFSDRDFQQYSLYNMAAYAQGYNGPVYLLPYLFLEARQRHTNHKYHITTFHHCYSGGLPCWLLWGNISFNFNTPAFINFSMVSLISHNGTFIFSAISRLLK